MSFYLPQASKILDDKLLKSLNNLMLQEAENLTAHSKDHHGQILDSVQSYNVIDCDCCKFRHLNPIPTPEVLSEFYRKEYYESHKSDYLTKDADEDAYWRIAFEERLLTFEKFAPGRRILDVGCGSGGFLRFAMERGWHVVGIEPSSAAAKVAQQSVPDVYHGTLEQFLRDREDTFDVIHLKNVLEHLPGPRETLEICHRRLKRNGVLYVEVPNDYDLTQRVGVKLLREKKSWIRVPDHINYFSFFSLARLLRDCQFAELSRDTTFPMYLFLWFGQNFIKHAEIGARLHQKRMQVEMWLYNNKLNCLKRAVYKLLAVLGLGRTVILYSRKIDPTKEGQVEL